MQIYLLIIFTWIGITSLFAADEHKEFNNGEDFTRPISRFDFRFKYQMQDKDIYYKQCTLRTDRPFLLKNGWSLSTRLDVPYAWIKSRDDTYEYGYSGYNTNLSSSNKKRHGLADVLFQALLITPTFGKWTYGAGFRIVFPTTKYQELDSLQCRLLPTLGIKYDLKDWMKGAWCALLLREDFNITRRKSQDFIQQTYIQPFLNIDLPRNWFITFSPEMRFNWKSHLWFIPFDILVGKEIHKKIILSVEYKKAIVDDFPIYKQEFEIRLGIFY